MICKGIYNEENKVESTEYYLKLTVSKMTGFPYVQAVYPDGTPVPHGKIVVFSKDKIIKTTNLNPKLGFLLDPDKSVLSW